MDLDNNDAQALSVFSNDEVFKLLNETVSQMKNMNGNLSSEFYALLSLIITSLMLVIAKGVGTYLQNRYSNRRIKIETDKSESSISEVKTENDMKVEQK